MRFIVSPGTTDALYDAARGSALPYLEIMRGLDRGYRRFKFFPAERAGGLRALKDFAGPFADLRFCPTGGIGESNFAEYLALPNVFAVGGSWPAPAETVEAGDWTGITTLARRAVETARRSANAASQR